MVNDVLRPAIGAVGDAPATRLVVGYNWTAVLADGVVGLAWSPRTVNGARTTDRTGRYAGTPLRALADLAVSDNPYERSIGVAAINAWWNRPTADLEDGDGLSLSAAEAADASARVVVIGGFPSLDTKLPGATVLELDPETAEVDVDASRAALGDADAVFMTASALVNGTADLMLSLCAPRAMVTLLGPGTPLCPGLLDRRLRRLAGFLVTDPDAAFQAVMEGAGARRLKPHGRAVVLSA